MSLALKLLLATLSCVVAAAAGWWLHTPKPFASKAPTESAAPQFKVQSFNDDPTDDALALRIAASDPFGLNRNTPFAKPADTSGPTELIEWRLAALVVRSSERYLVMTSQGQAPLKIAEGGKLPNGDQVKSIGANQVVVQGARGRTRTIYLTEP